jgi:hypothetical protein
MQEAKVARVVRSTERQRRVVVDVETSATERLEANWTFAFLLSKQFNDIGNCEGSAYFFLACSAALCFRYPQFAK